MTTFLILCAISFGFLFVIWNRGDAVNLFVKLFLFGMTVASVAFLLQTFK